MYPGIGTLTLTQRYLIHFDLTSEPSFFSFFFFEKIFILDTDTYCNTHAHTHIRLHGTQYNAVRRQFTNLRVRNTRARIIHSYFQTHTLEQTCNEFYHY